MAQSHGQYTFVVKKEATKVSVKKAIKEVYGVEAKNVRISILPSKMRLLKGKYEWPKRPMYKKAIVTLKDKKTIDPNKMGSGKAEKAEKVAKVAKEKKAKAAKKELTTKE